MLREQHRTRLSEVDCETSALIVQLRNQGLSHRKIAAAVGLSHGNVMRILKWQETGEKPKPSKPAIPKRPRNGEAALPDFERVSDFEAKGLTIKDSWLDYANGCGQPYTYAHFSTLYKVWLAERAQRRLEHVLVQVIARASGSQMAGRENTGLREPWDPNGAPLAVCARNAGQELAKIWGVASSARQTAAAPIMEGYRGSGWTLPSLK